MWSDTSECRNIACYQYSGLSSFGDTTSPANDFREQNHFRLFLGLSIDRKVKPTIHFRPESALNATVNESWTLTNTYSVCTIQASHRWLSCVRQVRFVRQWGRQADCWRTTSKSCKTIRGNHKVDQQSFTWGFRPTKLRFHYKSCWEGPQHTANILLLAKSNAKRNSFCLLTQDNMSL